METGQTRSQILLVLTHLPDEASAQALATALVTEHLAACVNVLAPCRSVYRWQGKVESATEVPLLIKSTTARYAALEAAIRARHPYELPEIVAVPIAHGLPEYLTWLIAETGAETLPETADGKSASC
ncbi:MAG: divalent-cation tolerance protein CutA [Sulfuritalea sp.]|jgi:periplasmic divalent cation tolerance protein|nr:divalent-cation tolerance protein CutA [Sulfuritalea sp.]